jgi:hypothetical protein
MSKEQLVVVGVPPKHRKGVYTAEAAAMQREEYADLVAKQNAAARAEAVAWLTKMKAPPAVIAFLSR